MSVTPQIIALNPMLPKPLVTFDRHELSLILNIYGAAVAQGEWRDYALDFTTDSASFAIYRRSHETPLYRIVKTPALARKQGAYAVLGQDNTILKRGHALDTTLRILMKKPKLI